MPAPYFHLEAELRRLLRRAGNPYLLAANPLAQALCEATKICDAQDALRATIEQAFRGNFREKRLGDMLLRSIEGGELDAREVLVSKRHLQRRRAQAVSMLAFHIGKVIGGPSVATIGEESASADPLETIAQLVAKMEPETASKIPCLTGSHAISNASMLTIRHRVDRGEDLQEGGEFERSIAAPLIGILRAQSDEISGRSTEPCAMVWPSLARGERSSASVAETRFELEWLGFIRVLHRGDVRQVGSISRNLQRLALGDASWALRALTAQAEARIRSGRLEEAARSLDAADRQGLRNFDLLQLACSSALRAELAFLRGDHATSERLATGAYVILQQRHFLAYRCLATIARARLRLGEPWNCPDDAGFLRVCAWDRIALEIELARHWFAAGEIERCRTYASSAWEIATARGYDGLAARAAATIGATCQRNGKESRRWYLKAFALLLACRDRSVADDLFALDQERVAALFLAHSGEELAALVYDGLVRAIPHLRLDSALEAEACRKFLAELIAFAFGAARTPDEFERSVSLFDAELGSFAQYFVHFLDDASDVLHTAFQAISCAGERARTEYRLAAALRRIAAALRPRENLRRFLVG
jgi:hypothetical protein